MTETKEFNRRHELGWIEFKVDGETFRATNSVPALSMIDVSRISETTGAEQLKLIMGFLDEVLDGDSSERMADRLRSRTNPVDIEQLVDVLVWLVETYAPQRPTTAPSPSPNGSGSDGTSTAGTASTEASTQGPSTRRVL